MAGITGMATTFDLPNFVGDLFGISPEDTPLLSAIGGLTGGRPANDKRFEWEFYDLRAADANRQQLEGATVTAAQRVRSNASNVVEIHQEAVSITYTRSALSNQGGYSTTLRGTSPVVDEMNWQLDQQLKMIARDVNNGFINGTYQSPSDNTTPRKTRGLLQAIATNTITAVAPAVGGDITGVAATDVLTSASAHGLLLGDVVTFTTLNGGAGLATGTPYYVVVIPSTTTFKLSAVRGGASVDFTTAITTGTVITQGVKVTSELIGDAMQLAFDNGGLQEGETRVAIVNSLQKRRLTKALIIDPGIGYQEQTRNVGGVDLTTIVTDFGVLNIMLDRYMPIDTIAIVSMEDLAPRILEVPGKGFLFLEPLAKTGAFDSAQIYGEIGLEYGNERKHAKIVGLG